MDKKLLNLAEACKYVGRTEQTMRDAIHKKEIPCKLFRGGYIFSTLALDLWATGMNFEEIQNRIEESITKELITQVVQEQVLVV